MRCRRLFKSVQALVAYFLLLSFTLLLVLKLDHFVSCFWWLSLPEEDFHCLHHLFLAVDIGPLCHAVVATPLLFALESLLFIYMESIDVNGFPAVNLKIVFLQLLVLEIIILIDNFCISGWLSPWPFFLWPQSLPCRSFVIPLFFELSRLLGRWSIDEGSCEEQARLYHEGASGGYPPEVVKKMPKKDLEEEVWRLQAALGEQKEPKTPKLTAARRAKKCPICRASIEERLPVCDV